MHSMLACHDYPWLSFGKQLLYDDFETCWNVCFWRKNNLNIIRHEAALQHWIQDRNRTKTLPQKGPRKCEADDGGCGPVEESRKDKWNWRMDSSTLRTLQRKIRKLTIFTAKTNTSCWHESRTPRDPGRYLCSSFFIQACQYPVPAKMDVKEPIGKPQDSLKPSPCRRSNSLHRSQIGSLWWLLVWSSYHVAKKLHNGDLPFHDVSYANITWIERIELVGPGPNICGPSECLRAKAWSITAYTEQPGFMVSHNV